MFRRKNLAKGIALALGLNYAVSGLVYGQTNEQDADDSEAEVIIVTGTNIKNKDFTNPTPIETFSLEDIELSGLSTTADFITRLPSNNGSEANAFGFRQNNTLGTAQVNLRGLGLGSTLVLVNSRRLPLTATFADDGSQFVDINQIPLAMIKRVDVLKSGASAIYGSDAVAGVVNFITHDNYDGAEISANFQNADGGQNDFTLNGIIGWDSADTNFTVAATYFDRTSLGFNERDFTARGTEIEQATAKPGSFVLLAPSPVPEFSQFPTFAPITDPGCASAGGTPTGPIGFCQVDTRNQFDLIPEEERLSVFATLTHTFNDNLSGFIEASYTDSDASTRTLRSLPGAGASGSIIVAPNNQFNIFRTPAIFVGRPFSEEAGFADNTTSSETTRFSAGLTYVFENEWQIDTSVVRGESEFTVSFVDLLADQFFIPGTNTVRNDINLFSSSITDPAQANSPELIDSISVPVPTDLESTIEVFDIALSGALGEIGSREVSFTAGFQYRAIESEARSELASEPGNLVFIFPFEEFGPEETDVSSLFAEVALPITEDFDAQIAVRHEDYGDDIGSTTDPKLAIAYSGIENLTLRASAGTSFRAPTPLQTGGSTNQVQPITNPCSGQRAATSIVTEGSADLQPEDADTFNFGFAYANKTTRASIDYFNYDYNDTITRQSADSLVAGASCVQVAPGVFAAVGDGITLDPNTGNISRVDVQFVNAGAIETDGLDFALGHKWSLSRSTLDTGIEGTWVNSFDIQETTGGPVIDGAGQRNITNFARPVPEFRVNATMTWERDNHQVSVIARYVSSYDDDLPTNNSAQVDSQTVVDIQYRVAVNGIFADSLTEFAVGAINLFDQDPSFVNDRGGYDPLVADPRGRLVYAKIKHLF